MKIKLNQSTPMNLNPVLSVGMDGTIFYSNQAGETLLNGWDVELGEKLPSSIVDIVRRVISRNSPEKTEIKAEDRVFLVVFSPLSEENRVNISGFDMSEQKRLEEKLRDREKKYRNVVETSVEGIWIFNSASETTYVNEKMAEMLGYNREEIIGRFIWDFASKEDKDIFRVKLANRKQGIDEFYELKLLRKDGSPIWISVSAKGFFDDAGKFEGSIGMFTDITDRKKADQTVRESKAKIESIFRSAPVGIGVVANRMIKEANDRLCEMTGYSREELLGKSSLILYPTFEEYERVGWVKYSIMEERGTGSVETRWQRKDGTVIDIFLSSSPIFLGDLSGEITFTALDITGRKRAEEALKNAHDNLEIKVKERTTQLEKAYKSLKESEKSLAEAQEIAHIGNWDWNIITGEVHWSDEMYRIFGRNPQTPPTTYNEFLNCIHPDDRDYVANTNKKALKGEPIDIDHRISLANGEERAVHAKTEVIFDEENRPIRLKGIVQDITERKMAEEKLRISEEKYRNIVETANEGIVVTDCNNVITYANNRMAEMLGYTVEEGVGRSALDFLYEEDRPLIELYRERRESGLSDSYEMRFKRRDGSILWAYQNAKPLFDDKGNFKGVMSMFTDITKRKETEESLAYINIARQKEIHHRIKNNLQVISSLLDLQADKLKNKFFIKRSEVLEAFKESQQRVISMALIHEEMYKAGEIDTINFSQYIEKLAGSLFSTYRVSNEDTIFIKDIESDIFFDMDISVPLGIIINELISNSLKYAFPDRDTGKIQIKLHREKEFEIEGSKNTTYALSVSDNGVGIPKNLNIKNFDGLGLQLVTTLVDQLNGELEVKRDNGTEFIIRFTVEEDDNHL